MKGIERNIQNIIGDEDVTQDIVRLEIITKRPEFLPLHISASWIVIHISFLHDIYIRI